MIWIKGAHQGAKFHSFHCSREISPNLYFGRHLLLKVLKISAKMYRGVMSHDTKQWCKIWRETDLLFQKWRENWWILTRALESLKTLFFDWFLLCKVYKIWPKKYRGLTFHDTGKCKIWRKTDLWFGKWHEELSKLSPEHLKVLKLGLWWDPFVQSRKCIS